MQFCARDAAAKLRHGTNDQIDAQSLGHCAMVDEIQAAAFGDFRSVVVRLGFENLRVWNVHANKSLVVRDSTSDEHVSLWVVDANDLMRDERAEPLFQA